MSSFLHHHGNIWIIKQRVHKHAHHGKTVPKAEYSTQTHGKYEFLFLSLMNGVFVKGTKSGYLTTADTTPTPNKEAVSNSPTFQTTRCKCALHCVYPWNCICMHTQAAKEAQKTQRSTYSQESPGTLGSTLNPQF